MKQLIKDPVAFFEEAKRPSGHDVTHKFGKDNGGAIPPNLIQVPNSESNSRYTSACKAINVKPHPARFPVKIPELFIRFLTDPGDLVVDIFAGSNTTGMVAEAEERRWLAFDERADYLAASAFRFLPKSVGTGELRRIYERIEAGESVKIRTATPSARLFA